MTDVQSHLARLVLNPGEPQAMQAVEATYRAEGRWEELLRVYEDNALRGEKTLATQLLRSAATLCVTELASPQRAEQYLRRVLELDSGDASALHALREIYLARGDYEHGTELFERELARLSDGDEKVRGLIELGELYRDRLNRVDKALIVLRQAQRAGPANPTVYRVLATIYDFQGRLDQVQTALLKELEVGGPNPDILGRLSELATRLLERPKLHDAAKAVAEKILAVAASNVGARSVLAELGDFASNWQQRSDTLAQRAQRLGANEGVQMADLWLSVAEIQLIYGKQPEAALTSLDRALQAKAGHAGALRLLEEIFGSQERYGELAMKLEMMAAYTREPEVAVDLYLRAAIHNAVRLDNPDASARIYLRVLELDPGNKVASNALAEYYRERRMWEPALQILSSWAGRATVASDKVAAHYACCRILEEELNDRVRARPHYEAILVVDPENQAAAQALEDVYRRGNDHPALARALHAKLAALSGPDRIPVLEELGRLQANQLKQANMALMTLGEVYQMQPTASMRERLEELAAQSGEFASLVHILEGGLDHIKGDSDRLQALHSLAALYEGARDAPLEALRMHRRILAIDANDVSAKEALDRLLHVAAATGDKVAFYQEQMGSAASDAERVTILRKLALELAENAKDYVRAIDVYRQLLRLQPDDAAAIDALLSLYRRDNRWAEVAEMLAQKVDKLTGGEKVPVLLELAQIFEERLVDVDRAVDRYCEILVLAPENKSAVDRLEALIPRARQILHVAETLQPRFLALGEWEKAIQMLEIRVKSATDTNTRAELLISIAALFEEKLQKAQDALATLLRAFQAAPNDSGVQVKLEQLATKVGDFKGVTRAYRATASTLEHEARQRLLLRAGNLAEKAGDLGGAAVDYLRLLGEGEDSDAVLLEGLRRLLKAGLDNKKLVEAASQVADGLEDPQRTNYWRLIALFYERDMKNANEAIAAWKTVLASHQSDPQAVAELDRLYQSAGDAGALVQHLRSKAESVDETTRAAILGQVAELLADKLNDIPGAIGELTHVVQLVPGQKLAWQRLADLRFKNRDMHGAAEAMHHELGLMAEGGDRHARLVDYASLLGQELGDIAGALTALQGVTTQRADFPAALALLEQMVPGLGDAELRAQASEMLLAGYTAGGKWREAVGLQSGRVDSMSDPAARAQALRQIAQIKADKLNDLPGAYADLERAFRDHPLDTELRAELERIAEGAQMLPNLVAAYGAALGVVGDPAAQKPLQRKLAELLTRLGRANEAIEHLRAASGGSLPEDLPSLESMEKLYRQQNRFAELAEVLEAILPHLQDTQVDRKKAIRNELAQVCENQLADKPRAVDHYQQVVALDAKNLGIWRRLEQLLGELNRPQDRVAALEQLVGLGPANTELVDDLVRLAQTQAMLSNFDEAVKHYRAALLKKREYAPAVTGLEELVTAAPNKMDVAQVLEPIYTARQDHQKLAWILEARLESTTDNVQRKGLIRRIGDIYENRLQQKDKAFAMARKSLGEDPADMGVRMWIEKLAGETSALSQLADVYVEEAQKAETQLSLQFHRRAAAIYHEKLNDAAAAVNEYQAIIKIEARDEKALTGMEAIFRSTNNFGELVELLRKRLAMTAGLERKREYLNEIAAIQTDKLADLGAGVASYREILALTPDDISAFQHVEHLLAQLSQWEELSTHYDTEIKRLADKRGRDAVARRLELTYRRGRVLDEQFGDRAGAAELFDTLLSEEPTHGNTVTYLEQKASGGSFEAIGLLEKVYRKVGAWQKLVQLFENELNHVPETEKRREIYLKASEIYGSELKMPDLAFGALTKAYNENRADLDLLSRLDNAAQQFNKWPDLVAVIGVDLDAMADPKVRQTLLRKLGQICGEKLGDVNRAIAYFQAALQYDRNDEEALASLDALLDKNQMWSALADLLEKRIDIATSPAAKSQLLERLATVWGDRLHDAEAALRCHQQILEIDPDHPISLKSMQKLYAEVQNWDALAKNLLRQAEVLTEKEDQVRIHAAAGELFAEELGDNSTAIEHWQKVMEFDPAHKAGTQALDVLLSAEERWDELAQHYRRQLQHTPDPLAKAEINRKLGTILGEKLGRTEDALESWLQVLKSDGKNLDAMRALLGLYTERAMWPEFVDIAKKLIPLTDPAEAKEVRFHLAKALGENLGQRDEAIKLAREYRATEPHTADNMTRLAEMLIHIESFDEAVIALEKSAVLEGDSSVKVARYYQAADLYRDKIKKPNDAREVYEAIRVIQPNDNTAYAALSEIYRNLGEWRKLVALNEDFIPHADPVMRLQILTEIRDVHNEKLGEKELAFIAACRVYKENPSDLHAAEVLEKIGVETNGVEELVAVLEDEVERIVDGDIKVASYRRIARLYAEKLQDSASAEGALNKLLVLQSNDLDALDAMASLGATTDRHDKQISALEAKLQHVPEDTARKAILFDIARIWEDHIGELDDAVNALNRILEIDGSDVKALDELARLYEKESRWAELAHTLTRKVELTQDAKENVQLRMRVAGICEGDLNDHEAAIQWYRGVLEFDAAHTGALAALERLYTGHERWSELVQTFEQQINISTENDEKIRILSKMASIYETEFESPKDATACFERVLQLDSSHILSIKNLERLLRGLGEWHRLIEVLQHHLTLLKDPNEITDIYLEIGEIYYRELSRVDKAEEIYNAARDFNPQSAAALHALGQLYERSGNWFQSLEMLQKEAEALGTDAKALPVLVRIGKINEDMLGDSGAAQQAYRRALEIDPNYPPALQALKEIAKGAEDWDAYAEHLIAEAEAADDLEDKTELFFEAAKFFQDVRQEEASAIRFYQRALDTTPGHLESAKALAETYFRNEDWQRAGDLYRIVVQKLDKAKDAKDFCQKNYRLGYISEKLGERDKALTYFKQAFEADATYLPALEGLGHSLLAAEKWDEAQKIFQTVLIHHRDSLTESEIVDLQWQLGDLCLKQNQPDRAYKQFEKALEIDPDHGPTLNSLAQLEQTMERWDRAFERLSRLADVVPANERGKVLLDMSAIAREKLGDASRSIEALERARRMGQPPIEILERLANFYLEQKLGTKAVEVLEQALTVDADKQKLSEISFLLGSVYEKEIKHEPMAVQKYNTALDLAPTNVKAFEAIERLLSARQEWGLLEENYRAMLARAKDLTPAIRLVLWRNLAELYRQVLRSVDHAIMAYEVIQKLEPGKPQDTAILAQLYAQKPEHRKKSIEMQHLALPTAENPVEPIRMLRKLYHAEGKFDAVYMLCSALTFLKEADAEEKKIFEYLAQGVPAKASRGMLDEQWQMVLHPDLSGPIGTLAAALYRAAPDVLTIASKDLNLKKKDLIDVRQSDLYFANMMRYVGKMLNVQGVDLYRKSGSIEPLHLVNAQPPALVAGENHEVFRDSAQKVVLYHIGRNLAYAKPEMFLAAVHPGDQLRDLLLGLCIIYNRSFQHNGDPREVERWASVFERLPPQVLKRLQQPTHDAYKQILQVRPLEQYAAAVEITASRAGLIAAGDLNAAVRGITEGGEGASNLPTRLRVKELVLFAVSKPYLQLRETIGAALVAQQPAQQARA